MENEEEMKNEGEGNLSEQSEGEGSPDLNDSVFKIFISTDNHLGYKENDSIRGDDSFEAFDEVLDLATKEEGLDFLLLGGDLFHEFKPTRTTFLKAFSSLKKYVFGDQNIKFKTKNFKANYSCSELVGIT